MRFPIIHQHDASDCGPAALAMITAWHGKRVGIARLRDLAGTGRQGTTVAGLSSAAEEIGFSAKAVRALPDVMDSVDLPVIAHWREDNKNHFVVVYKIRRGYVHVADPALGRRKLTRHEFQQNWTGVLVLLKRSARFRETIATHSSLVRLCSLLRPHLHLLLDVLLAAVLITILGLTSSFFIQGLIDFVFLLGRKPALNWLGLGMLIVLLARSAVLALRTYLLAHLCRRIDADTVMKYHRHLVGLPLTFFATRRTGEILSRLNDAIKIRIAISTTTLSVMVDALLLVATTLTMLAMNWRVTLVSMALLPLAGLLVWAINKPMKRHQRTALEKAAEVEGVLVETVEAIQTIKGLRAENSFYVRMEARFAEMLEAGFRSQMIATHCTAVTTCASGVSVVALLWLGGRQVLANTITVGQLMALNAMLGMFLAPLEHLATASQAIQDGLVAADRLGEILDLSLEKKNQSDDPVDRRIRGAIDFENVSFRYGSGRWVLREVSLHIDAGECVGIAGESGSGKTTLVSLLARFFEACDGTISIDGIDIRDYSFDCLRREIAFMPQDIVLFNTSIAENIRIGRPAATVDEIHGVASAARVDEIIRRHPLGFETIVGERGLALSGGERQRIALARALLQDPAILVLDEPTSHLDAASENAVENLLNRRRGRRTTVVISHRPTQVDRTIHLSQPIAVKQKPVCTDSTSKA